MMEIRYITQVICVCGALFCCVKSTDECLFRIDTICNVMEGKTIHLSCRFNNLEPVVIYKDIENDLVIVEDDMLKVDAGEYRYHVVNNITEKTHILTIYNVSRSYKGQYYCLQTKPQIDSKPVTLQVFHPPSKISCDTDSSFNTFIQDKIQTPFDGKCSVYDGYPSVDMSFTGIPDSLGMNSTINRSDGKIEGRFSVLPNVRLNNSVASCIVRQHYPTDLNLPDYVSDCSFKPFRFLTEFAVWITPSNVTIHHPQDIHFVCSSNAENIEEVSWILSKLPTGVSHSENSNILTLHIREDSLNDKSLAISIKCQGYYRNRSTKDEIFVIINLQKANGTSPAIVFVVGFLLFLTSLTTITCIYKMGICRNNNKNLSSVVVYNDHANGQDFSENEPHTSDVSSASGPISGQRCNTKADHCDCFRQRNIVKKSEKSQREGIQSQRNFQEGVSNRSEYCRTVYRSTVVEHDVAEQDGYEVVCESTTTSNIDLDSPTSRVPHG